MQQIGNKPRAHSDGQAGDFGDRYRALFAVADAIASHRDLNDLFRELASRLAHAVRFDALSLVLHDSATDVMRLHLIELAEALSTPITIVLSPADDPAGVVWQTQQALIISKLSELER